MTSAKINEENLDLIINKYQLNKADYINGSNLEIGKLLEDIQKNNQNLTSVASNKIAILLNN